MQRTYYHAVAEDLPNMFIKACAYLGVCNGSGVRLFLYHSDKELGYHEFLDWAHEVPFIQDYLDCFTDYPVLHPSHPWFADKVGCLLGCLLIVRHRCRVCTAMYRVALKSASSVPTSKSL